MRYWEWDWNESAYKLVSADRFAEIFGPNLVIEKPDLSPGEEYYRATDMFTDCNHAVTTIAVTPGIYDPGRYACFGWPDAPEMPDGWPGAVPVELVNGKADFVLDAKYWPDEQGPYYAYIFDGQTKSETVRGLGLVDGTNHQRVAQILWVLDDAGGDPPPEPPPDDQLDRIEAVLVRLEGKVNYIASGIAGNLRDIAEVLEGTP